MDYRRNEIRAGIFLLVSFVILVILVFAVSDIQSLFKKKKEVKVLFAYSDGIERNAPVRYAGMKVGKVEDVRVSPEYSDHIELTLSVYRDTIIKKDTHASIKTLGLVGGKYIELNGGSPDSPDVAPGEVLRGEEALKIEDIEKAALDVVAKFKNIVTNLDRTFGDPGLTKSLRTTIENIQEVTANVKVMTSSKEEVAEGLKKLPDLLKKMDGIANNLQAVTDKSDKLLGDNRKNIDAMMQSLKDITQNVKETTDDVKKHPWKLIRKP